MTGRIYKNFKEAFNEIKRDLAELGTKVPPMYQSLDVSDNMDYSTMEMSNYSYTVLNPNPDLVPGTHDAFVEKEFADRLSDGVNPGTSWRTRPEVWQPLLEISDAPRAKDPRYTGRFSYTYSERMGGPHLRKLIQELKDRPYSRQLYLPVWNPNDENRRGTRRVPCSLGYWFVFRQNKLHLTYMMRSCDFHTHMANDVCLASMMLYYIASKVDMKVGTFTHFVGSLHVYKKDVADVF